MPSITVQIPPNTTVFDDKKSHVKSMAVRFVFPNQIDGIISVTKLSKFPWVPNADIESITINFKEAK